MYYLSSSCDENVLLIFASLFIVLLESALGGFITLLGFLNNCLVNDKDCCQDLLVACNSESLFC